MTKYWIGVARMSMCKEGKLRAYDIVESSFKKNATKRLDYLYSPTEVFGKKIHAKIYSDGCVQDKEPYQFKMADDFIRGVVM